MKKHRVKLVTKSFWIEVEQDKKISKESKRLKTSRSQIIRDLIDKK